MLINKTVKSQALFGDKEAAMRMWMICAFPVGLGG
jgi:hypothetical protein